MRIGPTAEDLLEGLGWRLYDDMFGVWEILFDLFFLRRTKRRGNAYIGIVQIVPVFIFVGICWYSACLRQFFSTWPQPVLIVCSAVSFISFPVTF